MEILALIAVAYGAWWLWRQDNPPPPKPTDTSPPAPPPPTAQEREQAHVSAALRFTQQQSQGLQRAARERLALQRQQGKTRLTELDGYTGQQFERFLAGLLTLQGYHATTTPASNDYGADLILTKGSERIALQAKRYQDNVGVEAVQEVVAAKAYYDCTAAWVVTTARFTPNAISLADRNGVVLIGRDQLAERMGSIQPQPNS